MKLDKKTSSWLKCVLLSTRNYLINICVSINIHTMKLNSYRRVGEQIIDTLGVNLLMQSRLKKVHSSNLCLFLLLIPSTFLCAQTDNEFCWEEAARRYSVDPLLLYSIAQVESNLDPKAFNDNGDTQDYGIMQINSWWLEKLSEYDIDKEKLYNPCININIGAWILNHSFGLYGHTWDAVGAYNAGTSSSPEASQRRSNYARKVYERFSENKELNNDMRRHAAIDKSQLLEE